MEFFLRHKTVIAFIFYVLFCIVSLAIHAGSKNMASFSAESVVSVFVISMKNAYNSVTDGVGNFFSNFSMSKQKELRKELAEMKLRVQKFQTIATEITEVRRENERLKKLLSLQKKIPYDTIPAQIISKDPDNWFRTIVINKGRRHGLAINMPVVSLQGDRKVVIGKIIEVRGSISRVLPLISPKMKLGVKINKTSFPGLLYGFSINSSLCIIDYLSSTALIKKGDEVITSGQGGVFPEGLAVGRIIKSKILQSGSYQRAIVKPWVKYATLEEVFIIKRNPHEELMKMIKETKK